MPKIISSAEQFEQIKSKAREARIVRYEGVVKLKLRTSQYLYTFTTNAEEAEDLIKGIKEIEVVDYSHIPKNEKSSDKKGKTKVDSEKD